MSKEADISIPERIELNQLENAWPFYHRNELALGKIDSPLAIATLWTQRQGLEKILGKEEYSVIGQCFSARGVSLILRELLANPNIRTLVTWGRDSTGTGEQIKTFFETGINADYTLPGFEPIMIHEEIPMGEISLLRKNVRHLDLRGSVEAHDYKTAAEIIKNIPHNSQPWRNYGMRYPLTITKSRKNPGEIIGYQTRGTTVEETWLDILDTILRFGKVKEIPGEDSKLDIPGLTAIVTGDEDYTKMSNPDIFKYIPDFENGVKKYVDQFTSPEHIEEIAYHYGEELFAHDTRKGKINQIQYIIKKLSSNIHSGRAFASSWNVGRHMEAPEGPCLVDVQFSTVQDEASKYKLVLMSHFKTHDMFSAWPSNVFGLRELQKLVLRELRTPFNEKNLSLDLGPLTTVSGSAHIYGGQVENAQKTLQEFPLSENRNYDLSGRLNQDPRGNYTFRLEGNKVIIDHYNHNTGEIIETEKFSSRAKAEKWMAEKRTSDPLHTIYVGRELANIFTYRELRDKGINVEYHQDRGIVFPKD